MAELTVEQERIPTDGENGLDAYEIALEEGFVGTRQEWLDSLKGEDGEKGEDGTSVTIIGSEDDPADLPVTGNNGDGYLVGGYLYVWINGAWENVGLIRGPKGDQGNDGRSIEYIWNGTQLGIRYEGETNYTYQNLKGEPGQDGEKGDIGPNGLSAYEVWLQLGNTGTIPDFFESLTGPEGLKGDDGYTPVKGVDYFDGEDGTNGLSAYQVWISLGNSGSQQDFIESLTGPQGEPFTYENFTPEQLEGLIGPQGEPFTYEDFTPEQLEGLVGPQGEDAQIDNELIIYKIPISELSEYPTEENISMLVKEWFNSKGYIKEDIQTVGWEVTDYSLATYVQLGYILGNYVE